MNIGFSNPKDYPVNLRGEILKEIFSKIVRGQSIQIVGVTGSGKSLLLKAILESQKIREYHLGESYKDHQFILVDLKFSMDSSINSLLRLLLSRFGNKSNTKDISSLILEVEKEISIKTMGHKHLTIIFDSFNELPNPKQLFEILKGLYDQNRGQLSYLFAVNHEVEINKTFENFGNITPILTENILFIPPLTPIEFEWFIKQIQTHLDIKLTPQVKLKILEISGGNMSTIKRIMETLKEGVNLQTIIEKPESIDRINYHFQTLLKDIESEQETLEKINTGSISEKDRKNIEYLQRCFLLTSSRSFTIPLFEKYLTNSSFLNNKVSGEVINDKIKINSKLTSSEYRVIKYLCSKLDQFCSREEIIESVWDGKAKIGISDHALDQIIYRLRKKLEKNDPQIKIKTVWGRGHKAELTS